MKNVNQLIMDFNHEKNKTHNPNKAVGFLQYTTNTNFSRRVASRTLITAGDAAVLFH